MKKYERLTCVIDGEARVMETKFESKWAMQKAVDRLAELEDKIESGTLIELPCKVGDTVYVVSRYYYGIWNIYECFIDGITIYEYDIFIGLDGGNVHFGEYIASIGRDIFLTKAEAEAKLKELRGERE